MSGIALGSDNHAWLEAFRARRKRAPRMLHIGNIANNAYNNARLLNLAGLDCDVICYDYYHIMACPEWEDGDFTGEIDDHFRPDWTRVELNGFRRPPWFAQGPILACIDYLAARRAGDDARAQRLWAELAVANRTAPATRAQGPAALATSLERSRIRDLWPCKFMRVVANDPHLLARLDNEFYRLPGGGSTAGGIFALAASIPVLAFAAALRLALAPVRALGEDGQVGRRIAELRREFATAFPDRRDRMVAADVQSLRPLVGAWRALFDRYDLIQAYSTDPIIPLLAGRRYFAFEHGTLRDIPFAANPVGRTTSIAYRRAQHVFVTNFDCLDNAHALAEDRVTLINHPYDEDHGLRVTQWEPLRGRLAAELDAQVLFFFPTRHDWVEGTGYADKANDVFLRAFARLRREGLRAGLVCCPWGANVRESRELLARLGCAQHVKWVEPMDIVKFERMAKACHCVVDQFKLGAFGGVMFKAMAVGSPILTYLDEARILRQYAEIPPVINCRSEEQIVERFTRLAAAPGELEAHGAASRVWMKRHHGRDAVVNAQMDRYRELCAA